MTEAEFWSNRIRPRLNPYGFFKRVENGLDAGMPDVYFHITNGAGGWIENKFRGDVPRPTTVLFGPHHGLRKEQKVWLTEYLHYGKNARAYIFFGVGQFSYAVKVTGWVIAHFNEWTMNDIALYPWDAETWVRENGYA